MQQALETFLNTIESTPSLLALDGALRYVFPLLALVILLRCGKSLLLFFHIHMQSYVPSARDHPFHFPDTMS